MKRRNIIKLTVGSGVIKGRSNIKIFIRLHFLGHYKQASLPKITLVAWKLYPLMMEFGYPLKVMILAKPRVMMVITKNS